MDNQAEPGYDTHLYMRMCKDSNEMSKSGNLPTDCTLSTFLNPRIC